jgi:hypothetical protein
MRAALLETRTITGALRSASTQRHMPQPLTNACARLPTCNLAVRFHIRPPARRYGKNKPPGRIPMRRRASRCSRRCWQRTPLRAEIRMLAYNAVTFPRASWPPPSPRTPASGDVYLRLARGRSTNGLKAGEQFDPVVMATEAAHAREQFGFPARAPAGASRHRARGAGRHTRLDPSTVETTARYLGRKATRTTWSKAGSSRRANDPRRLLKTQSLWFKVINADNSAIRRLQRGDLSGRPCPRPMCTSLAAAKKRCSP